MANTREIQDRIKSINDTKKITSAMYLISSSKLKKAKKSLTDTEPYFYTLQSTIARILKSTDSEQTKQKYFEEGLTKPVEERKKGYIVVTADKGLAGAYNHNVIKIAQEQLDTNPNSRLYVIGQVGMHYFQNKSTGVDQNFRYTIQNPTLNRARNIAETLLDIYEKDELDEVYIIYTKMINSMSSEAELLKLLPLKKGDFSDPKLLEDGEKADDFVFIPSADSVFETIVPNWISGLVYGALVEAYCSEQNSRMMAMQSSTDSANDMLRELNIIYNRVRQAAITQEITEVISGAKAQKKKKG
jgi:F-type H+-transporting ATPase subunit gamma